MKKFWPALVACLALPASPSAHRLDEYLQATRIAVERDRIDIDLDLTPGVAVASQILPSIDANGDGVVSPSEADAYAASVLRDLTLSVDGRPAALTLTSRQMPNAKAMQEGIGTIQLTARAHIQRSTNGRHSVLFRNGHRLDLGVYLANALVPDDAAIAITAQQRDVRQRELRIDYTVSSDTMPLWSWNALAAALAATLLTWLAWRRRDAALGRDIFRRPARSRSS